MRIARSELESVKQRIPLDTAVFPVAVIALGIAVDDTIHFISRHIANRRAGESREASVRETVEREFRPIVTSSVAIAFADRNGLR